MEKKTVLQAIDSTKRTIPTMDRVIEEMGGGIDAYFDNYQLIVGAQSSGIIKFQWIGERSKRKCHVMKVATPVVRV